MSSQFQRLTRVLAKSLKLDEDSLYANFRLATPDDIQTLSELRRRIFGDLISDADVDYLHWRYFGRKHYPSTLWVYEYGGKVIAALGTEPVNVWYHDRMQPALRNMDAIIEPKYDGRGLGAWMTLAMQARNDCVLVTGGNENSTSMLNKLFTALPVRKNYKVILNAKDYLRHKIKFPVIRGLLTPLVNLALMLYLNLIWLTRSKPHKLYLTYFDDVQALIKQVDEPVGCIGEIKVVRTPEYLQWRYVDNPSNDYHALGLFDDDGLQAYVIYKYEDVSQQGSTRIGQIIDWYVRQSGDDVSVLGFLFIKAIKKLKEMGSEEVMMVLNDDVSEQAASYAGFVYRYVDTKFFVYHAQAHIDSRVFCADAWYHCLGDTDTV